MPDSLATHNQVHELVNDMLLYGLPLFLAILFKGLLEEVVMGVLWRYGSHLDPDDIIKYEGRYGRIARIGILKTVVYLYTLDEENRIIGGDSLTILNSELRKRDIAEPLKLVDHQAKLNPIVK